MARSIHRILFVCGGNTCRSPMAAAIFAYHSAVLRLPFEVDSAGMDPDELGKTRTPEADAVLEKHGYPLSLHRARQVSTADLEHFDLIIPMTFAYNERLKKMLPEDSKAEIRQLSEFVEGSKPADIPDPLGGGIAAYEEAFGSIEARIKELVTWLSAQSTATDG